MFYFNPLIITENKYISSKSYFYNVKLWDFERKEYFYISPSKTDNNIITTKNIFLYGNLVSYDKDTKILTIETPETKFNYHIYIIPSNLTCGLTIVFIFFTYYFYFF